MTSLRPFQPEISSFAQQVRCHTSRHVYMAVNHFAKGIGKVAAQRFSPVSGGFNRSGYRLSVSEQCRRCSVADPGGPFIKKLECIE
jgi:hypothetical protein